MPGLVCTLDKSLCTVNRNMLSLYPDLWSVFYIFRILIRILIHTAIDEITGYLLNLGQTDIYNLGLTLGLNHLHLKKMRDLETFRDDVIAAWLQKEDQVTRRGVPTYIFVTLYQVTFPNECIIPQF